MEISIKNCEFNSNGATDGPAVMRFLFPDGFKIYNIELYGNVFKHSSSQAGKPVVEIVNELGDIDDYLEGALKRSMIMSNNTFEENGSHGTGVVYIERMPNVDILDDNVFSSNTDSIDANTYVVS